MTTVLQRLRSCLVCCAVACVAMVAFSMSGGQAKAMRTRQTPTPSPAAKSSILAPVYNERFSSLAVARAV